MAVHMARGENCGERTTIPEVRYGYRQEPP